MKKKILFCILEMLIISSILFITIRKNNTRTFIQNGVRYAVYVDGVLQNTFPNSSNYNVEIDCGDTARGRWMRLPSSSNVYTTRNENINGYSYKLLIDNVTDDVECIVSFTTINTLNTSDSHFLNNIVMNAQDSGVVNEGIAGYRYEGRDVNNYIWYNNEMWRIIGLIPTCTTANCGNNTTNLVKIIRNELIGAYWVGFNDITWSASSLLYQTLNNGYLTKTDVTSQSYCARASNEPKCNFLEKGIGEDTFYGNMIQNVYWNTGGLDSLDYSVLSAWQVESSTNNVQGKIGMMSIIDYCYSSNYLDNSYLLGAIFQSSWLYGQGREWTLSSYTAYGDEFFIAGDTTLSTSIASNDSAVRPSLFLKSSVYVVSGDGSEGNPYQIAM